MAPIYYVGWEFLRTVEYQFMPTGLKYVEYNPTSGAFV